jgi:hypothetical protein
MAFRAVCRLNLCRSIVPPSELMGNEVGSAPQARRSAWIAHEATVIDPRLYGTMGCNDFPCQPVLRRLSKRISL